MKYSKITQDLHKRNEIQVLYWEKIRPIGSRGQTLQASLRVAQDYTQSIRYVLRYKQSLLYAKSILQYL